MGDGEGDDDPGAGRTSFMFTVETMLFDCDMGAVPQTGGRREVSDKLLLLATGTGTRKLWCCWRERPGGEDESEGRAGLSKPIPGEEWFDAE